MVSTAVSSEILISVTKDEMLHKGHTKIDLLSMSGVKNIFKVFQAPKNNPRHGEKTVFGSYQ
jgi:hypothetical protein